MILRQNRNFGDRFQVKTFFFFFFREHPDFGTKIGIFSRLRPANSNNFEKWPTRVQKLDHPGLRHIDIGKRRNSLRHAKPIIGKIHVI